jgi:hypothetical protein
MSGVRLHHPELRSVTYTITNYAIPLKAPMVCASCKGFVHTYKTYHLNIDNAGDVIVAEELTEMMQRTGLLKEAQLMAMETIAKPPPMVITPGHSVVPLTVDREKGLLDGKLPE